MPAGLDRSCPAAGAVDRRTVQWEGPAASDIRVESLRMLHVYLRPFLRHLMPRFWRHEPIYSCFWLIWWRVLATHARIPSVLALLVPHRVEDERMHVLGHLGCSEESI